MITKEEINKLNELYKKSQSQFGLTEREKEEQLQLRQSYVNSVQEKIQELRREEELNR